MFMVRPHDGLGMGLHATISDIRVDTLPHCCFACWVLVLGQWHELTARQVVGEDFASLDLVDPSVQMEINCPAVLRRVLLSFVSSDKLLIGPCSSLLASANGTASTLRR